MATKSRLILTLLMAAAGAAGMGTLISAQNTPAVDPIVTGSNRPDPRMHSAPVVRSANVRNPATPSSDEVKAFFESQLKQVRNR